MKNSFFLLSILILIFYVNNLQCGEENIEHCLECNQTDINSCEKCEDKYFPFLENVFCLPCDHNMYGEEGCGGKCTYNNSMEFSCEENKCKEGYFSYFNQCRKCSYWSSYCGKCTYESESDSYNCIECLSNQYKMTNNGYCTKCYMLNCKECHYEGEKTICDICNSGYYLKDNDCIECTWQTQTDGRFCEICSDDVKNYKPDNCLCPTHYTKGDSEKCVKCPENCFSCGYNSENKNLKCYNCDDGYTLNSQGNCVSCGDDCEYCILDSNNNPICLYCKYGVNPNENNNCLQCGNNCESCIKAKDNTIECTKCYNGYGLKPDKTCEICPTTCKTCFWKSEKEGFGCSSCYFSKILGKDDKCISCSESAEIGYEGCNNCYYDKSSSKYKCTECSQSIFSESKFVYVENEYKCIDASNPDLEYMKGCVNATYNSNKKKYECLLCDIFYPYLSNEKRCLVPQTDDINYLCYEANNIGTEDNPIYSCLKCLDDMIPKIKYKTNKVACEAILGVVGLSNCIEGTKNENGAIECTKCNFDLRLTYDEINKKMICPDSCGSDSFLLYKHCHKCDDKLFGNPGCLKESGCNYYPEEKMLNCSMCKEGYFSSSRGCSPCAMKNKGCKKCSGSDINNFKCQECFDGYVLNNSLCQIMECEEYPEITAGCLICKDKLDDYKQKSKCQSCKEGFFKTKDETCVFCKSNTIGGHGCEQCAYSNEENKEIECTYCPEGSVLDQNGRCLICEEELGEGCSNCMFVLSSEDNKKKLICTKCKPYYYLASNGQCIYPQNYKEYIPNCEIVRTQINPIFEILSDGITTQNILYSDYKIEENKYKISSYCDKCKEGYYLNNGKCIYLNIDNCTFSSIMADNSKKYICNDLCSNSNKYVKIDYYVEISKQINDINSKENIMVINKKYKDNLYNIIDFFGKSYIFKSLKMNALMCIGNLGTGDNNNPVNLKKCKKAEYNKIDDKYECTECLSGYSLNNETKTCIQSIKLAMKEYPGLNCEIEIIGTDIDPIYSCKKCNNENDKLVTTESGAKFCTNDYDINGCIGVNVDTNYIKNKYDCTNCSYYYILYNSKYYQSNICQYIFSKIKRSHEINITEYIQREKDYVEAKNGVCESKKMFTPDQKNCFACNSVYVGMPGCKKTCTFYPNREYMIECEENGCKSGYIESSKGICTRCSQGNNGCIECHYGEDYQTDYKGLKRKRRFVCDQCDEGYLISEDSLCHSCYELGLYNCEKCNWDENKDNEIVCTQCYKGYFLNEFGECTRCYSGQVRVQGNKCAFCNNIEYGGIDGCSICKSDNEKITECLKCDKGFIFYENEKKCLKIANNTKLEEYPNCIRLYSKDKNEFECTLCETYSYTLIRENIQDKCVSSDVIPTHNIYTNRYCEKFVNLGTDDKPKYSCHKCIENEFLDSEWQKLVKITFQSNDTNYCDLSSNYPNGYCTEAIIYEEENNKLSCKSCYEDNIFSRDNILNTFTCEPSKDPESFCQVKYCKTCQKDNANFCEKCVSDNYMPDSITGSCVKKTEKVPSITWKDIYNLKMNQRMNINGNYIYGPSLILRGFTFSQINEGHSFSFYLYFDLKNSQTSQNSVDTRNLQEQQEEDIKKVPMVCLNINDVDESEDEPNLVEYICNGNLTIAESEKLNNSNIKILKVEEDGLKNEGKLLSSNLEDLNLDNIYEERPHFPLQKLLTSSIFRPDEIKNQTSKKYKFEFSINGKLSSDISKDNIDVEIPFAEVDETAKCKLNMGDNKKADLNCNINLEQYSNQNVFSFKSVDCEYEDKTVILSKVNEIYLIIEKDNDNKMTLYIIIIAGGVGLIIIIIIIVVIVKKKNPANLVQKAVSNIIPLKIGPIGINTQGINPMNVVDKIKNNLGKINNKKRKFSKKRIKNIVTNFVDDSKAKIKKIRSKKK